MSDASKIGSDMRGAMAPGSAGGDTGSGASSAGLALFQGEEHQPFHWVAGPPAALLVHGFPGTPAELRPLGQALYEAGWTVSAPLLPGFGPRSPRWASGARRIGWRPCARRWRSWPRTTIRSY